jgi:thermitase
MRIASSFLAGMMFASGAFAAEYVVKYRNPYALQTFNMNSASIQVMDVHDEGQIMKVNIPERARINGLVQLLSDPNVEYVVPNVKINLFKPIYSRALRPQWANNKVRAAEAWAAAGKGKKAVTVAVIDTGVQSTHESLKGNMTGNGYDFAGNDASPEDETSAQNPGHGTHCAGIIGATGTVEQGVIGIAPNISLMAIRFLDKNGSGDLFNGAKSIDHAIKQKVDVISASWGMTVQAGQEKQIQPVLDAIARAEAAGIPFVVAAANDGKNNDKVNVQPANAPYNNVISVAASDVNDKKPSWSNFGRGKVAVAAPGADIMSTVPSNKYQNMSGTSMATPLVAGLVALVRSHDPSLTPPQIKSLLQATGQKVAIETACDCRVDALGAVETVINRKMFISPFAATVEVGKTLQFEAVYAQGDLSFTSSNPSIATIDNSGLMTAASKGEVEITVTDSSGAGSTSHKIYVGQPTSGGGGGGGSCPLGDQATCDAFCQIAPTFPWCQK